MHIFLEMGRLTLRRFSENDVHNLFDLNSGPDVMRCITGGRSTPREEIRDEIIPLPPGLLRVFAHVMAANAASRARDGEIRPDARAPFPYAGSDAVRRLSVGRSGILADQDPMGTRAGSDTCPAH